MQKELEFCGFCFKKTMHLQDRIQIFRPKIVKLNLFSSHILLIGVAKIAISMHNVERFSILQATIIYPGMRHFRKDNKSQKNYITI